MEGERAIYVYTYKDMDIPDYIQYRNKKEVMVFGVDDTTSLDG
jgi:hypothetical protein